MGRLSGWVSGHHVSGRTSELVGLMVIAAILQAGAAFGMAYVAGFSAVHAAFDRVSWSWLGAVVGGLVVSFAGYFVAYRGVYRVGDGLELPGRQMSAVVAAGFGGFLAHGGPALDDYALRAAGARQREATVRVSALAGLEHGVLAVLGTAAAIAVLTQGLAKPPGDFTYPWAVIPVPGFALAFWLAERHRDRLRQAKGWRAKLGVFLDSIHLNRLLFLRPVEHGPAVLGMAVFWVADAFAVWAALEAFDFRMNAAALFIGFATGMVFTRRTGPLGGTGVLMVVLSVTIWYSGAPFAAAVLGVFVYRVAALWLPMPFALASLPTLRRMGRSGRFTHPGAEDEPALRPKSA